MCRSGPAVINRESDPRWSQSRPRSPSSAISSGCVGVGLVVEALEIAPVADSASRRCHRSTGRRGNRPGGADPLGGHGADPCSPGVDCCSTARSTSVSRRSWKRSRRRSTATKRPPPISWLPTASATLPLSSTRSSDSTERSPDPKEGTTSSRPYARPSDRACVESWSRHTKPFPTPPSRLVGCLLDRVYLLEGAAPCPGLDGLLAEMLQLPGGAIASDRRARRFTGGSDPTSGINVMPSRRGCRCGGIVDV